MKHIKKLRVVSNDNLVSLVDEAFEEKKESSNFNYARSKGT